MIIFNIYVIRVYVTIKLTKMSYFIIYIKVFFIIIVNIIINNTILSQFIFIYLDMPNIIIYIL